MIPLLFIVLFVCSFVGKSQTIPATDVWTVKVNVLSPLWKNFSGEVEYMPLNRVAFFVAGGVLRSHEDAIVIADLGCTDDKGFGLAAGAKYYLAYSRSGRRSVNGLAAKMSFSYNHTNQIRQTCPTFAPTTLESINAYGVNIYLAAQKTFFDRVTFEIQGGVGYALQAVSFKRPEPLSEIPDITRKELALPFALNIGVAF